MNMEIPENMSALQTGTVKRFVSVSTRKQLIMTLLLPDTTCLLHLNLIMEDTDIYNTYHNLWRIEESFKLMKSDLDARPAFVQKEDTIKGHFLICYLTVLLERLFQFKILDTASPPQRFSAS